jgi:hypothetical protein
MAPARTWSDREDSARKSSIGNEAETKAWHATTPGGGIGASAALAELADHEPGGVAAQAAVSALLLVV